LPLKTTRVKFPDLKVRQIRGILKGGGEKEVVIINSFYKNQGKRTTLHNVHPVPLGHPSEGGETLAR